MFHCIRTVYVDGKSCASGATEVMSQKSERVRPQCGRTIPHTLTQSPCNHVELRKWPAGRDSSRADVIRAPESTVQLRSLRVMPS